MEDFGIIANVVGVDRVFRKGAKVWLCYETGGEGWFRFEWYGASRSGHPIQKWSPTDRFANFRASWVPEHLRERVLVHGTRTEMEARSKQLEQFALDLREGRIKP